MFYQLSYVVVLLFSKIFFPIKVHGTEHLPKKGGFLFACNHQSFLDPVVMAYASPRPLHFVAREDLFKNKIFAWVITHLNAFPIKRDYADIGAVKETLKRLRKGCLVLVFPEGTRHAVKGKREVHAGVAMIALKAKVPVIPSYVKGTDKVLSPGKKFFTRHHVEIFLGAPFYCSHQKTHVENARQIIEKIYQLAPS